MARVSASVKAAAAPPPVFPEEFQMIPLTRITESDANPRKRFDSDKLSELAQSIREHGVIEPVIVRPLRPGAHAQFDFELICGARRLRASRLAGKPDIPAMIRDMDDKAVLEVMCIENANREDVHPLEEGEAFLKLVHLYGDTVQHLAEKIGKSERYVQRRLKLAALIPEAKEAYFDGKLTLEHYNILARLEPASQKKALPMAWHLDYSSGPMPEGGYPPNYKNPRSPKDFEEQIRNHFFLSLKSAPWDKTDAALYPAAGACSQCTKRTGASPLLFDEAEKSDNCLDLECFEKKRSLYLVQVEKTAKKQGVELVRVATSYVSLADQKALNCLRSYGAYEKVSKSSRCPHTQRALVVAGDNVGAQLDICTDKKCKQHMGKPSSQSSARMSAEQRQAAALRDQKRKLADAVTEAVVKGILAKVPKKLERRELILIANELFGNADLKTAAEMMEWGLLPDGYHAAEKAFVDRLKAAQEPEIAKALVALCLVVLADDGYEEMSQGLRDAAADYAVDVRAIEKKIAAEMAAPAPQKTSPAPAKKGARKKTVKPVRDAKRAAANDLDDEDLEAEFDGSEELDDEG